MKISKLFDQITTSLRKNKTLWTLAGLGFSLILVVYLIGQADLPMLVERIKSIEIWKLGVALLLYLGQNLFRAFRYRALLDRRDIPISRLYPITLYHNLLVRILPMRTGEVSYVTMLRRYLKQPISEGVSSLVGARIFELILVVFGGLIGLIAAGEQLENQQQVIAISVVGLVASVVGLYFAGPGMRLVKRLWDRFVLRDHDEKSLISRISRAFDTLADQFDRYRTPRIFALTMFHTVFTYSISVGFHLWLMETLGINYPIGEALVIISIAVLTFSLPISFGEIGLPESGWTVGLVVFGGMAVGEAASMAFLLNWLRLLAAAITGLLGYGTLQLLERSGGEKSLNDSVPSTGSTQSKETPT
ncbi:MAG: flippase-like domain-containing protein [Anaerolineae bacterium]|nr:flippase-like domain-containing protein [Anaerolineae bacterium]